MPKPKPEKKKPVRVYDIARAKKKPSKGRAIYKTRDMRAEEPSE